MYLTRVLEVENVEDVGSCFIAQYWTWRTPLTWHNIPAPWNLTPVHDYDDTDYVCISAIAKTVAEKHKGMYLGLTGKRDSKPNVFLKKLRKVFTGPIGADGLPGAPGPRGSKGDMGEPGPAYDDVQCPHCKKRRSQTNVVLFMEVLGNDKFGYTCRGCKTVSEFLTSNGVWVLVPPTEEKTNDTLR